MSQQSFNARAAIDLGDIATAARLAGQVPVEAGAAAKRSTKLRRQSMPTLGGSVSEGSTRGPAAGRARKASVGSVPAEAGGGLGGILGGDDPTTAAAKRAGLMQATKKMSISDAIKHAKQQEIKEARKLEAAQREAAQKTDPTKCVAYGDGLKMGMTRQLCTFTIEARDALGNRRTSGGDVFLVTARGASVVKVHVFDNNDGLYACQWRPSVSGQYHISCFLHGVALPESPFGIDILAPNAESEKCVLGGEALHTITAREVSRFEISFVDALGQVTHAEELDVFVMPREPGPPKPTKEEQARLDQEAKEAEERRIQEAIDAENRAIEEEAARIELEKQNASKRLIGKRRGGAQNTDLKQLQALAQDFTKKVKETERVYGSIAKVVHEEEDKPNEAMPSGRHGQTALSGSRRPSAERAPASASPAQSARPSARSEPHSARQSRQGTPKGNGVAGAAPAAAGDGAPQDAAAAPGVAATAPAMAPAAAPAMAPAVAAAPTAAPEGLATNSSGAKSSDVVSGDRAESAVAAGLHKTVAKELDSSATEGIVPADEPSTVEGGPPETPSASRNVHSSRASKALGSRGSVRGSPSNSSRFSSSRQASSSARVRSRSPEDNKGVFDPSLAAAVSVGRNATPATAAAAATSHILAPRSRHVKPEKELAPVSPKHPKGYNPNHPTHPKLDGGDRQRHMRLWQKQLADEQSRLKAEQHVRELLRERYGGDGQESGAAELKAAAAGPSFASEIGLEDPPRPGSPRKLSDGFAYGGVYPGTIHARGQLVKTHTVNYAIGRAGSYWLHVGLRTSSLPLPGSPFELTVLAGRAHALSSRIPASELPLRTVVGEEGKLVLHAADRMGNLCYKGGDPLKASEPTGRVQCSTRDLDDGRYEFSWKAEISGTYFLHIAVAGSLLYGSPTELTMSPAAPAVENCEVVGTGLHRALAGRHAYLRIRSKDRFSNPTLPGLSMSFGLCIIPAVKQVYPAAALAIGDDGEEDESVAHEPIQKPMYSDEEIYGVTKAAAIERAKRAEEEKRRAEEQAKLDQEKKKADAMQEAAAAAEEEKAAAEAEVQAQQQNQRKGSIKLNAPPPVIAPPPELPGGAKPNAPKKSKNDEKSAKAKAAAEKRAAEAAQMEKEANKAAKRKEEEDRIRYEREVASKATPATVQSIDFEGAWRAGGEYEIRYMAKEAGNFALHIWCDLEGNGERHRLPGSPFHLLVSPAAPSAKGSTIELVDKLTYVAGDTLELQPQLRDAFGNPTELVDRRHRNSTRADEEPSVASTIMKELLAQHGLKPPRALSGSDRLGTAATSPNKLRLARKVEESQFSSMDNSPALIRPDSFGNDSFANPAAQGRRSSLSGNSFVAARRDVTQELSAWLVSPKGTTTVLLRKVEGQVGLYVIDQHVVTISGQYEAHFALNGVEISGSPYSFQVTPADGFGRNSYVISPDQPAFVKLPYELTLHAVDKFGNKLGSGGSKVEGKVIGANASACTVVDHKDGTYSLHFTVNATGSYNVEVRIDGAKVKGTAGNAGNYSDAAEAERKALKKAKAEAAKKEKRRQRKEAEAAEAERQAQQPTSGSTANGTSVAGARPPAAADDAPMATAAVAGLAGHAATDPLPRKALSESKGGLQAKPSAAAPAAEAKAATTGAGPPLDVRDLTATI